MTWLTSSGSIVILRNRRLEDGKLCGKKKKKKSNIDAEKDRGKEDNRDETRGTRREEYHVHIRLL